MNLNFFCRNIKLKNVVVNFQKLIYNIDEVILMISFNKEEIDSMLLIQQNFAKILLAYIEKLVSFKSLGIILSTSLKACESVITKSIFLISFNASSSSVSLTT